MYVHARVRTHTHTHTHTAEEVMADSLITEGPEPVQRKALSGDP